MPIFVCRYFSSVLSLSFLWLEFWCPLSGAPTKNSIPTFWADLLLEGDIVVSVTRTKHFSSNFSPITLIKFNLKLTKMLFYVVILALFKITVIRRLHRHRLLQFVIQGTYEIILEWQIFPQITFKFTT